MNSTLPLVARALRDKNITTRFTPVDYIPIEERRRIVERMLVHVWRIANHLGFTLGGVPTIISGEDKPFLPRDVLEDCAHLNLDVLCAYHVLGTADVARDAVEGLLDKKHPVNFQSLIDDATNPSFKGLEPRD